MDQNTVAVPGAGQIGHGFAVQAARYEMDDVVVTPHVAGEVPEKVLNLEAVK